MDCNKRYAVLTDNGTVWDYETDNLREALLRYDTLRAGEERILLIEVLGDTDYVDEPLTEEGNG